MKSRVGVCSMPMSHGACPNRTHVVCTSMSPDSAVASTACQTCEIVREILSVKKADIRPTSCGPGLGPSRTMPWAWCGPWMCLLLAIFDSH